MHDDLNHVPVMTMLNRFLTLLINLSLVGVLLLGALILLFNVVFSPAWKDLESGLLPSNPVEWIFNSDNSPLNQPRVIQMVRLWARLAPLPKSAQHVIVDSAGQPFTKTYIVTFTAETSDIQAWLSTSPGTSENAPLLLETDQVKYVIQPRDAASAEVVIGSDHQTICIKASWM